MQSQELTMSIDQRSVQFETKGGLLNDITLVCFLCIVLAGPYINLLNQSVDEGSLLKQVCFSVILMLALIASRYETAGERLSIVPASMVIILAYCALSCCWSAAPDIAFRRWALTALVMFISLIVVRRAGFERTTEIIRVILAITLFVNYITVVAMPDIGIHQALEEQDDSIVGAWKGVLVHKNFAGPVTAFTFMYYFFAFCLNKWIRWLMLAASAVFLFGTHSKTSVGFVLFSTLAGLLYMSYTPSRRRIILSFVYLVTIVAVVVITYDADSIVEYFNRGDAFTGRTQIWSALITYWNDNWLSGAGFGSFWNAGYSSPAYRYAGGWVATVSTGHNGYLDLLVQIGLPGTLLAIVTLLILPLKKLLGLKHEPRAAGALLLACAIFCIGHNFTESSILDRDDIAHVFLVISIALAEGLTRRSSQKWFVGI